MLPLRRIPLGQLLLLALAASILTSCGDSMSPSEKTKANVQTPRGPANQDPGSERMARRLALLADRLPPSAATFDNATRLTYLQSLQTPEDPGERMRARYELARESLRAGESEAAAERLATILDEVSARPEDFPEGLSGRVRKLLAIAHLRVGEQRNCLENHTAESCLFPIREGGVHRIEDGSRAALAVLADILREEPDDLMSLWLYNLAAMTLGEHPEGVPEEWRVPPEVLASDEAFDRFPEVAGAVGLDATGVAGGVVVEDFDGDGYLDVVVSSWGSRDPLRYFRHSGVTAEGELAYEERSAEAGFDGLVGGLNLVQADYDNDGDVDLLVLRGAWMWRHGRVPNSLLRNDGDGRFVDVTEDVGLLSFHPTQTAAWADYDNDGWLDLFVGNESVPKDPYPSQLFRNLGRDAEGRVRFEDVATEAKVKADAYVKGVAWGDYDNDGWPDLYLSRMWSRNQLFRNLGPDADGRVRFQEVAAAAGVEEPIDSFAVCFFDYDNDGWLDLFVAEYATNFVDARATDVVASILGRPFKGAVSRLYRNLGDGRFVDMAPKAGLDRPMLTMGANFGDLDNDGWLDLYLGTGAPDYRALIPNRMFRNAAGQGFRDVTASGGFGHLQKGHGIAFGDLDNDGDQDIYAVMGGAFSGDTYRNALFANPGHDRPWVTLRLEGTTANRSALGARLRLTLETPEGPRQTYSTVSSGGSFGASSLRRELGLGGATAIRELEITWPGGERQVIVDVPMERFLHVRQGEDGVREVELEALVMPSSGHHTHHGG